MSEVLLAILLSGLMGMIGQGARAIVGLKTLSDASAAADATDQDVFNAARLVVSMMIGFIAGVAAGLPILSQVVQASPTNFEVLIGLAGAGYVGVDVIEGFLTKVLPGKVAPPPPAQAPPSTPQSQQVAALSNSVTSVSARLSSTEALVKDLSARPAGNVPGSDYPIWALQRDAKLARADYWAHILEGAANYGLPVNVVAAIGSKESQWGLALRPAGPSGTGDWTRRDPEKWKVPMPTDGKGWGRGLMQIDWASNDFARTGDWEDPRANILFGCGLLQQKIQQQIAHGATGEDALRRGVSAYNGMLGPDSPYCLDVIARADWIHANGLDVS